MDGEHEPVTTVTPGAARYSCWRSLFPAGATCFLLALLGGHDARDDRLPLVDLALKILRDLGGTHGLGLDGILLHSLAHWRPVHGVDDFVIDPRDDIRRQSRRTRQREPCGRDQFRVAELTER